MPPATAPGRCGCHIDRRLSAYSTLAASFRLPCDRRIVHETKGDCRRGSEREGRLSATREPRRVVARVERRGRAAAAWRTNGGAGPGAAQIGEHRGDA